jgi:hypothetical protein
VCAFITFIEHYARLWATDVKLASLFLIISVFIKDKGSRMYQHAHCVRVCSIFQPVCRFSLNLILILCHSRPFQYHILLFPTVIINTRADTLFC